VVYARLTCGALIGENPLPMTKAPVVRVQRLRAPARRRRAAQ